MWGERFVLTIWIFYRSGWFISALLFRKVVMVFNLGPRQYGPALHDFSTLSETSCESCLFNNKQVAGKKVIPQEQWDVCVKLNYWELFEVKKKFRLGQVLDFTFEAYMLAKYTWKQRPRQLQRGEAQYFRRVWWGFLHCSAFYEREKKHCLYGRNNP